ncbi:MAG: adenosylmethionine decarboxylase [Candidatus Parvarchaeum sp.]
MEVGTELIVDYFGVNINYLEKYDKLKSLFDEVLMRTKLGVVNSLFYNFEVAGCSGIYLLKTSHLSFHTFPERNILALDVYTCGDKKELYEVIDFIRKMMPYKSRELRIIERGKKYE